MILADGRAPRYRGSHRRRAAAQLMVLPAPPDDQEKYVYAHRHLPYLAVLLAICSVAAIASQARFEALPWMWPFSIFTAVTALAFGLALPFSFAGPGFDWAEHQLRVHAWSPARYPDIDIYLPICAEPIEVLRNTWTAVFELCHGYPGFLRVYVLDDGVDPDAERLAANFGFHYVVRPDPGAFKKAGNLRHAFTRTSGEFFVILDADFAPRADFLDETLPYFDDPDIGIVQTPQYFRTSADQTWVERAAGAMQEIFYRAIQVSRDRLGAAICVGSCAVYRRAAVAPAGGPTLIAYAEDVHTGLDVIRHGWTVKYVPVVLATGMCPPSLDMFVHQQYRWCRGATSTVLTARLWKTPMALGARLSHVSGLAYYAQTALAVFAVPLIAIALLARDPASVGGLENSQLILFAITAGTFLLPAWTTSAFNIREVFPLMEVRGWAHALALWDWLRGTTMAWAPTGGPVSRIRRFRAGVVAWNGSAAAAWVSLAAWRTAQFRSEQCLILAAMGLLYATGQARVLRALLTRPGS
jgi:cellulose synthase/poly-beta-1,6-N-acetylglucosamine synthase-like glycosyltransferase